MTDYYNWKAAYAIMHKAVPAQKQQPVIGITGNFNDSKCELGESYFRSILNAGGTPLIIPPFEDRNALMNLLTRIDGLLLSGGADVNPLFAGEEPSPALHRINAKRDLAELLLIRLAYDRQIPMLGICRGIQMLATALDGSVHQDIKEGIPKANLLKHSQEAPRDCATHSVSLVPGSLLDSLMGAQHLFVNSFHHQAVSKPGPRFKVSATAPDGVIEAIESSEHKSILGVQWHPESFTMSEDKTMMPLFEWLVREAQNFHEAVGLHEKMLTLDTHCDTPMKFGTNEEMLTTLPRMCCGHLDSAIMVAYLPQKERDNATLLATTAKTNQILNQIEERVAANCTLMDIARTPADLYRLKSEGKRSIMLGIENGYAIGKDLSQIEHFRKRGVVYMTLCHNGDNDICDSAKGLGEHGGVSPFGRKVIQEMNRVGMMVDLSHASESSFWDALELSATPIVCSHSSCRALCDHPRNLTDEQMKALARRGGVMQVTLYNGFLRKDEKATILDAIEHINHSVSVMGIEHVGIGTDFDGDGGVPGVANAGEVINLTRRLLAERYGEAELRLIWGENFLRVMKECQEKGI